MKGIVLIFFVIGFLGCKESSKQAPLGNLAVDTVSVTFPVKPVPAKKNIIPFRFIADYPQIADTAWFIQELRNACRLEDDADMKGPQFRDRITYFKKVRINGSDETFIFLEYDYGNGAMATYPWKYQLLFRTDGMLVKSFSGIRFDFLKIFPDQNPFLMIVISTSKGNGGHEVYKISGDTLENVYEGYYDYITQTYDSHGDNAVFEPYELTPIIKDDNKDGYNDLVFKGNIVLIQGRTTEGLWYDTETRNGKTISYSVDNPFKKAPIEFVFLFDKRTGHFKAKEDYKEKYREYRY